MTDHTENLRPLVKEESTEVDCDKETKKMSGASVKRAGRRGRRPSKVDVKVKLERSRQSARECRARKKLRYQYLEELVNNREKSVFALKSELNQFKAWCKSIDNGAVPLGLQQALAAVPTPRDPNPAPQSTHKPLVGRQETPYDILQDVLGVPKTEAEASAVATTSCAASLPVGYADFDSQGFWATTSKGEDSYSGISSPWLPDTPSTTSSPSEFMSSSYDLETISTEILR